MGREHSPFSRHLPQWEWDTACAFSHRTFLGDFDLTLAPQSSRQRSAGTQMYGNITFCSLRQLTEALASTTHQLCTTAVNDKPIIVRSETRRTFYQLSTVSSGPPAKRLRQTVLSFARSELHHAKR